MNGRFLTMKRTFNYEDYQSYIEGTELDNPTHVEYLKNRKLIYVPEKEYELVLGWSGIDGISIEVDKIAGFYYTNERDREDRISLYDLLVNGNPFRFTSLEEFFTITRETSVQRSKDWLGSAACARVDSSQVGTVAGEMPTAKYFRDIDKYFIEAGKNRAFAGMLIKANSYCVATIWEYERIIDGDPSHQETQPLPTSVPHQEPAKRYQKLIKLFRNFFGSN